MKTMQNTQQVTQLALSGDDTPTPLSPTGQYPDPVWAETDYSVLAETTAVQEDLPTPPSPTGQYPDPVWAEVDYSGLVEASGTAVAGVLDAMLGAPPVTLDNQGMYQIIRAVAAEISGEALYEYVDASDPVVEGLRAGLVGFRQANGELGQMLQVMQRRDPSLLAVIMGPQTAQLIQMTGAATREERLQDVGSLPLWHQSWQAKFRQAGQQEIFQAAQNETAIEYQLKPMLDSARALGLQTDRGLALLYDRVVVLGLQDGVGWMQRYLPPANGLSETDRLLTMLQTVDAESRPRLENVFNSALLNGTTYAY